ncbi:hypothetical protein H5410_028516 [Solanum commersonii]|uniref:cellulase n=1 Tax=Solanum commersonii TaxID=4109 RepID=A0A9J5Z513_SOLCO|nr:hypothetical protein H5410_028516 [Solanum commersonii]
MRKLADQQDYRMICAKTKTDSRSTVDTYATMVAASIVFRRTDHSYSHRLLNKAKQVNLSLEKVPPQ